MRRDKLFTRILALLLILGLFLPTSAAAGPELGRRTLRPTGVDDPQGPVRAGLEEALQPSAAGLEEGTLIGPRTNLLELLERGGSLFSPEREEYVVGSVTVSRIWTMHIQDQKRRAKAPQIFPPAGLVGYRYKSPADWLDQPVSALRVAELILEAFPDADTVALFLSPETSWTYSRAQLSANADLLSQRLDFMASDSRDKRLILSKEGRSLTVKKSSAGGLEEGDREQLLEKLGEMEILSAIMVEVMQESQGDEKVPFTRIARQRVEGNPGIDERLKRAELSIDDFLRVVLGPPPFPAALSLTQKIQIGLSGRLFKEIQRRVDSGTWMDEGELRSAIVIHPDEGIPGVGKGFAIADATAIAFIRRALASVGLAPSQAGLEEGDSDVNRLRLGPENYPKLQWLRRAIQRKTGVDPFDSDTAHLLFEERKGTWFKEKGLEIEGRERLQGYPPYEKFIVIKWEPGRWDEERVISTVTITRPGERRAHKGMDQTAVQLTDLETATNPDLPDVQDTIRRIGARQYQDGTLSLVLSWTDERFLPAVLGLVVGLSAEETIPAAGLEEGVKLADWDTQPKPPAPGKGATDYLPGHVALPVKGLEIPRAGLDQYLDEHPEGLPIRMKEEGEFVELRLARDQSTGGLKIVQEVWRSPYEALVQPQGWTFFASDPELFHPELLPNEKLYKVTAPSPGTLLSGVDLWAAPTAVLIRPARPVNNPSRFSAIFVPQEEAGALQKAGLSSQAGMEEGVLVLELGEEAQRNYRTLVSTLDSVVGGDSLSVDQLSGELGEGLDTDLTLAQFTQGGVGRDIVAHERSGGNKWWAFVHMRPGTYREALLLPYLGEIKGVDPLIQRLLGIREMEMTSSPIRMNVPHLQAPAVFSREAEVHVMRDPDGELLLRVVGADEVSLAKQIPLLLALFASLLKPDTGLSAGLEEPETVGPEEAQRFALPPEFNLQTGLVHLESGERKRIAIDGTIRLNGTGWMAGALSSYGAGLQALGGRQYPEAAGHFRGALKLFRGVRHSMVAASPWDDLMELDPESRWWAFNKLKGVTILCAEALAFSVAKQRGQPVVMDQKTAQVRKMLEGFLRNPDVAPVLPLLKDPGQPAAAFAQYFETLQTHLQELGYKGEAWILSPGQLPSGPLTASVTVYIEQGKKWTDAVWRQLEPYQAQGNYTLVPDSSSARVVIGDISTKVLPGQALIQVDSAAAAQNVTSALLKHLETEGLLAPGSIVLLYKGDMGEDIFLFA